MFYLDPELNIKSDVKLLPYGNLICIEHSSVDTNLKSCKALQLPAILHYNWGFIAALSQKGSGSSCVLHRSITNAFFGHMTGWLFCLIENNVERFLIFLNVDVALNYECVCHKRTNLFIIKIITCSNNFLTRLNNINFLIKILLITSAHFCSHDRCDVLSLR